MGLLIAIAFLLTLFLVDFIFRKYGVLKDEFKRKTDKRKNNK